MPFLLVQFRAETREVLGLFGGMVGFASGALAHSFFVVQAFAVLFGEAFHVFILRHAGGGFAFPAWESLYEWC